MKTVPLRGRKAAGRVALIDDADFDLVMQYGWKIKESARYGDGPYAAANVKRDGKWGGVILMHNLIMGCIGVDHIDHNGLNNQRNNLRPATQHLNSGNRRQNRHRRSSAYKGVRWHGPRQAWQARIMGKHLGLFQSEEEAARTYDAAAKEAFGEYALLNFP